jgi:hypothetical protein
MLQLMQVVVDLALAKSLITIAILVMPAKIRLTEQKLILKTNEKPIVLKHSLSEEKLFVLFEYHQVIYMYLILTN